MDAFVGVVEARHQAESPESHSTRATADINAVDGDEADPAISASGHSSS